MFCQNCGSQMRDDDQFCPNCGALNDSGSGRETSAGGGKKNGMKLPILAVGGAVAVVAVVAILVVVVGGLFTSPKGRVEKAFLKSVSAYQAAEKKLGVPDIEKWRKNRAIHQQFGLELQSINSEMVGYDLSALKGLGLRMGTDYNGKARKLSMDFDAYWGSDSLFSFQMAADDDELSFASEEFTDGDFYGVNTETLGADLAKLSGDSSVKSLSFNLFDLVDLMLDQADPEEMEKGLKDATKTLWKETEVKKTGTKTLDVNGSSTKTTVYHVKVPKAALKQFVRDMETVLSAVDYYDFCEELLQAMGTPRDVREEILDELDELDIYGELGEELRDMITGDLELDVCLSGGYISALLYEDRIEDVDLELTVCLGGKKEYVDDLSMTLELSNRYSDALIEIQSSGDHSLKGGAYTDETTIRVREDGDTLARVSSELSYNPKGKSDNFQWNMSVDSSGLNLFALDAAGDLQMNKDLLSLDLNDVSVRSMGVKLCTLAVQYAADPKPNPISAGKAQMITNMSERELMRLGEDIADNAYDWSSDMKELFTDNLPSDLLWYIMRAF